MSSGRTLPPRLPKRKDIQSLRALAIVLVISAHAHIPGMQGGYIGVDVFFVLSGYLISGLILTEIENSGRFNALAFYARRLKRLLPALLVVLLSVAGIAWLLASPQQQGGDAEAAQAATLWLSNFYFAARVINYFSAGLGSNLFLHTWSLAVEEQFYLAWPWLVLFLLGAWRWQKRPLNRNHLTVGLALVGTSSLAAGAYWAQTDIPTAFYLMPGRAWEFSLGALTFILRQHCATGDTHAWPPRLLGRSVLNAAGLLMILLAACTYDDSLRYPGLWALLPTIGTALILLDIPESNPSTPLSKLLLQQPVLWFIGNISYSLYLWHWPVLILGGEIFGQGWITRAVLIALSVTLATVTYVLVERPIHQARLQRPFRVLVPSAIAMAAGFIATNAWQNSLQHLMQSPAQTRIEQATLDMPKLYRTVGCDTWYHSSLLKACSYGPLKAPHTVLMFGDSIMAQWFPAISSVYLRHKKWRLIVLTKSACSASDISYFYDRIKEPYTICDTWRQQAIQYIQHLRPDVIFMGSSGFYHFSKKQWISGTQTLLNRVSPSARSVIIMDPTPALGFNGLECLSALANWPKWLPSLRHCSAPLASSSNDVSKFLQQASQPYSNVHIIDLRHTVCPQGVCRAQIGKLIVFRDGLHLTASFVESLAPALEKSLRSHEISY